LAILAQLSHGFNPSNFPAQDLIFPTSPVIGSLRRCHHRRRSIMSTTTKQTHGGEPIWTWTRETAGIPDIPNQVRQSQPRYLRLVTHTMGGPGSVNHWTIFLVLSNAVSVHLNFRQGAPGEDDVMVVAIRAYATSNSAIQHWDFECTGNPTVQKFLQSIIKNKRYLYKLGPDGKGCREWV
jgi:hypothetical protein